MSEMLFFFYKTHVLATEQSGADIRDVFADCTCNREPKEHVGCWVLFFRVFVWSDDCKCQQQLQQLPV